MSGACWVIQFRRAERGGGPAPDQQRQRMRRRIGILDRRRNFRDVGFRVDQVVRDAHGIEDRLDDAHAVARRIARGRCRIVLQEPDHHADRLAKLDPDAADGVDGIEKAGVLDEGQRALVAIGEARRDADAFVLLADADELEGRIARNRPQQPAARDDVGHREDELDRARLERGNDARASQLDLILVLRQQIRIHRARSNAGNIRRYLTLLPHMRCINVPQTRCAPSPRERSERGEGWGEGQLEA